MFCFIKQVVEIRTTLLASVAYSQQVFSWKLRGLTLWTSYFNSLISDKLIKQQETCFDGNLLTSNNTLKLSIKAPRQECSVEPIFKIACSSDIVMLAGNCGILDKNWLGLLAVISTENKLFRIVFLFSALQLTPGKTSIIWRVDDMCNRSAQWSLSSK